MTQLEIIEDLKKHEYKHLYTSAEKAVLQSSGEDAFIEYSVTEDTYTIELLTKNKDDSYNSHTLVQDRKNSKYVFSCLPQMYRMCLD